MKMNVRELAMGALLAAATVYPAAADTYQIDEAHAEIGFAIRHMGISNVRGHFGDFSGSISYDGKNLTSLNAEADIKAESIDTGIKKRDSHLIGPDYFDAASHPRIRFATTGVERGADGYLLKGTLEMRGVVKEVSLPLTIAGPIDDPWGNKRIGLEITGSLKRHDWGIGTEGASDRLIGKEVRLEVNLEAVRQ